jgi:hypothetical protein
VVLIGILPCVRLHHGLSLVSVQSGTYIGSTESGRSLFVVLRKRPSDKMQFIRQMPSLFLSFALQTEPLRLGDVLVL